MNLKKHIPNSITLGNLLCGCFALVNAFKGDLVWSAYFVGIALVLDFFDGFTARALKVSSAIGKDLDSLADMVTFGLVPGVVMFHLINYSVSDLTNPVNSVWIQYSEVSPIAYLAFSITIFSAVRLAKFNNDTRQTQSFIGLPTPANAMIICSIPLILAFQPNVFFNSMLMKHTEYLIVLTALLSYLLVAELPLFALKFKTFAWADNKLVYVFLMCSVVGIALLKFIAIPIIILLYILISIVNKIFSQKEQ